VLQEGSDKDSQLPIWFQAIKNVSALHSAVDTLPTIISLVAGSLIAGPGVSFFGYYKPFMLFGCILMSVGTGLMTTFKPNTAHPKWIGYQVILGLGGGMSFQQPLMAAQVVLSEEDLSTGTAAIILAQTLGSAVSISIAQSVFTNRLEFGLKSVPEVNPNIVQNAGATNLKAAIDPRYLPSVIIQYNKAITETFYIPAAFASLLIIGAIGIEWRSVKEVKGKEVNEVSASTELAAATHHA
jgi:MFS family permease